MNQRLSWTFRLSRERVSRDLNRASFAANFSSQSRSSAVKICFSPCIRASVVGVCVPRHKKATQEELLSRVRKRAHPIWTYFAVDGHSDPSKPPAVTRLGPRRDQPREYCVRPAVRHPREKRFIIFGKSFRPNLRPTSKYLVCQSAALGAGYPTTSMGRIISLSSCSRMWQCHT